MKTFALLSIFCILLQQQIQFVQCNAAEDKKNLETTKYQQKIETAKRDRLVTELNQNKINVTKAQEDYNYQVGVSVGDTEYIDRDGAFKFIITDKEAAKKEAPNLNGFLSDDTPEKHRIFVSEGERKNYPFYMTSPDSKIRYAIIFHNKNWKIIRAKDIKDIDFMFDDKIEFWDKQQKMVQESNGGVGDKKSLDGVTFLPSKSMKAQRTFGSKPPMKDENIILMKSSVKGQNTEYVGNYKLLPQLYLNKQVYQNYVKEKFLYFNGQHWHITDSKNKNKIIWHNYHDQDLNNVNTSTDKPGYYGEQDFGAYASAGHWDILRIDFEGYHYDMSDYADRLKDFETELESIEAKLHYVNGFIKEYTGMISNQTAKIGASH